MLANRYFRIGGASITLALLAACGGAESRMERALENGLQFIAEEDYQKARIEFQNVLQIDPNHLEAIYQSGVAAEGLSEFRPAIQAYQATLNVDPTHAGATAAMARLYLFSGLVDEAIDLLETGLAAHPDDAELLVVRAAALSAQGQTEQARVIAERVVASSPTHVRGVALLAGIYSTDDEFDRAREITERALSELPENIELRVVLSQLHQRNDEFDLAEQALLDVIAIEPDELAHRNRLASFYLQAQRIDQAQTVLEQVVAIEPDEVEHKINLINFLLGQQSFDAAEQRLQQFVEESDGDLELRLSLGDFYSANGYQEDAEQIYREVADAGRLETFGLQARNRLATRLVQTGRSVEAEPLLEEVLAENPRDNDALILRSSLSLSAGRTLDAITDLRSVLRDQPDSPALLASLARAHVQNGETDLARENYRRSIALDPANSNLQREYAEFLGQQGDFAEAQQVIDASLRSNETDLPSLETLFRIQLAERDFDTASATVETITSNYPEHPVGYYLNGRLAEAQGDRDSAIEQYNASLDRAPRGVEPLGALARVLIASNRRGDAKQVLMQTTSEFPDHSVAHNLLGELQISDREFTSAVASADSAIASAPSWWIPYRTKALATAGSGDIDAVLSVYREGLEATDNAPVLGMDLAALLQRSDDTEGAIEVYEKVYDKNPTSDVVANNLAMLLATHRSDADSYARAFDLVERFRTSDVPSYLNTYGWVRYKQGNYDEAVSYLRRAAASEPDRPEMRYHLGMALLQQGQVEAARSELIEAVDSAEEFFGKEEARNTLETLPDA